MTANQTLPPRTMAVRKPRRARRRTATLVIATTLAAFVAPAAAGASVPIRAELPAPFNAWHVSFTPIAESPGTFSLLFNSPALGRQVTNTVYLPSSYSLSGPSSAVMYYLHGTVLQGADNPVVAPVAFSELLLNMVSQGGGDKQMKLFEFGSQLTSAHFLVVAPDTDPAGSICHTCLWINGQGPSVPMVTEPMRTESFMIHELQPLVEALFNVKTDRGGRGIIGFSMGGWSALLYGEEHPDLYSFVGSVSGVPDASPNPVLAGAIEAVGYLRSQGYGPLPTRDPVYNEEFNPAQMASNMAGEGIKLLFSTGDGCLNLPTDLVAPDCVAHPALLNPADSALERLLVVPDNAVGQAKFAAAGVPFRSVQRPGGHGVNNHTVYANDIVPMANANFSSPPPPPDLFDFRSADSSFTIWGYGIGTTGSAPEFTSLSQARSDGTAFHVTSPNPVEVTTPPAFQAAHPYSVVVQCGSSAALTSSVKASSQGFLTLQLPTGPNQPTCAVAVNG